MAQKRITVYQRTLQRAADILGGKESLRAYLHVPMHRLDAWLEGEQPPMDLFLRAVDVVSGGAASIALQRTQVLRQSSAEILHESRRVLAESRRLRTATSTERAERSAQSSLDSDFLPASRRAMLETALDAAISVTGAQRGNVQLAAADGLRIVAQRGFETPFLEYFAVVSEQASACGRALRAGQRVLVQDVASHEIFAGAPAAKVMEAAGARAVQSTPLVAASGWVLGMISTHFSEPGVPSEEALARVDQIARRTACWLEGTAATTRGR